MNMNQDDKQSKTFRVLKASPLFQETITESYKQIQALPTKADRELALKKEAKRLYRKFYLPVGWILGLENYFRTGKFEPPFSEYCLAEMNMDLENKRYDIVLRLSKRATQEDVLKVWKSAVSKYQRAMPELAASEFDDDELQMYLWRLEGKTSKWMIKEDGGNLISKYPNITYKEVNKKVSKMKRLLGIPKKSKKS